jgi:hypothetical protein
MSEPWPRRSLSERLSLFCRLSCLRIAVSPNTQPRIHEADERVVNAAVVGRDFGNDMLPEPAPVSETTLGKTRALDYRSEKATSSELKTGLNM